MLRLIQGGATERTARALFPSLAICDGDITYACVTKSDRWGYGVYSWHNNQFQAYSNARVTGGKCVPVVYVDGMPEVPDFAKRILDAVIR